MIANDSTATVDDISYGSPKRFSSVRELMASHSSSRAKVNKDKEK